MNLSAFFDALPPHPAAQPGPDVRSAEILGLIRRTFAEKGFDGASMQDLARAAGMSVGNFYRYFPSKAAIVEAMVGFDLAVMESDFSVIRTSADPMAALRATISRRVTEACLCDDGRLWAEITAAALRKPEIGLQACRMEEMVVDYLTAIFCSVTGGELADCRRRYASHARMIMLMIKGAAIRQSASPDPDEDLNNLILRTINRTLDEISDQAART